MSSSRIEKYEIAGLIGEGGFGRVFKAQDTQMKRWVAIKVMSVEQNETALQRFRNEAILAGGLNHPNLVTVYELGEFNGRPYIVMEYLEGRDLSHYIGGEEELPLLKKIDVLVQAARGLERAHRQQVVHRDIKPANIMLLNDGSVKVMDFGIARLTHEVSRRNTATGMVVGSLLWMAPEIFNGHDADLQTDIWSFGVMAFEFLCGEHPYQGPSMKVSSSTAQLIYQITQSEPPALIARLPDIPGALSEVVRRCMTRDRAERYHSLRDVVLVLLSQADQAASSGMLDRAMDLVRQALESDNESLQARQLRERLQREMKRRSSRDRIEMLLQQASDDVAARRIEEAIQKLKSALDLDPESVTARSRLEELEVVLGRKRQVDQIAAQAGASLNAGNLEDTGRLLEQAFQIEPNNSQLIQLQQSLVAERLRRDKRQRFQEGLSQAKEKLGQRRPDEALRILSRARDLVTGEPGLDSLLFELDEIRRESERQESVRQSIDKARILQKKSDWAGMAAILEPVALSSGAAWPEVVDLLATAQRELTARRRAEEIQRTLDETKDLFKKGDLVSAINSVERAVILYPEDQRFHSLQQRLTLERRRRDSETAMAKVQNEVKDLVARHKHSEAMRRVDAAAINFPEIDWREPRRRVAMEHARHLQAAGKHQDAVLVLETALTQQEGGADDLLLRLKEEIEAERESARHRNSIIEAASRARTLLDSGELEAALHHVESTLESHPQELVLLDLRTQTRERIRTREFDRRNRDLEARLAQVETSIALHDWDRASTVLQSIEIEFPGHASASELRGKMAAARRNHQMLLRRTDIETAIKLQEWDRAHLELAGFRRDYAGESGVEGLEAQIESGRRAARLRDSLQAVQKAVEAKAWEPALAQLNSMREEFGAEPESMHLDQTVQRARALIQSGDLYGARTEIVNGLAVKRDPVLEDLQAQVEAGIQERLPDARVHMTPSGPIPVAVITGKRQAAVVAASGAGLSRKWMLPVGLVTSVLAITAAYFAFRPAAAEPLTVTAPGRIEAEPGATIQRQLRAAGGTSPYRWTVAGGKLPEGVQLSESTGEIAGTTREGGLYQAQAKVTDQTGASQIVQIEIELRPKSASVATPSQPSPVGIPAKPVVAGKEVSKPPPIVDTAKNNKITETPAPVQQQPVRTETPTVTSEVGVADFARSGRPIWTGSLAAGAALTVDGQNASAGSLRGLPVPGGIAVQVQVISPSGVVVIRQPDAVSGWRSFQVRNDTGDVVSRIQFQWMRR
jgi:eukaryotic-like serine/threonine-protein kinase